MTPPPRRYIVSRIPHRKAHPHRRLRRKRLLRLWSAERFLIQISSLIFPLRRWRIC